VVYRHAPGRNISIARNAALDEATARFTAFIDDDEVARPGWLAALWAARQASGAEVVLGPVEAIYPEGAPAWMAAAAIHSTQPVRQRGEIRSGYSANVLIDRARPEIRTLRFDPGLGRSGGEDTDYFARVALMGGRFVLAPDAIVQEAVAPDRLGFRWLAVRRFRMGMTHARVLVRRHGVRPWRALPLAVAKALACGLMALAGAWDAGHRNAAVLRGLLHVGVVAGLAGLSAPVVYGGGPAAPEEGAQP
jgi:succinoglycan biosynthesis protein ExoM